jgi:putative colanic acid biosynthesis glycosyltransferase
MSLRIVHLNTVFQRGGAADVACRLHRYLNSTGEAESRFLFGRGQAAGPDAVYIGNRLDFYISVLTHRFSGQSTNLYFSPRIREELEKADVIHLHNLHGYYLPLEKLMNLLAQLDRPVVWYFHDLWPLTGRCAFPDEPESGACFRWQTGCGQCPALDTYPRTFLDRSAFGWKWKNRIFHRLNQEKTVILCPTRWLAGRVEKSFFQDFRTETIPYGLELPNLETRDRMELRKKLGLPEQKKLLLFVAADLRDRRKGLHYIQAIMPRLPEDTQFVSVGEKTDEFQKERLIQLGFQSDRRRLMEIFRACDLYINPTLAETFSQTTAEAMAVGTPVVAFQTDPLPEVIGGEQEAGLLVEKGNAEALLEGIKRLLAQPELMNKMGQAGQERFRQEYTVEKFGGRMMSLYRQLVQSSSGEVR